MDVRTVLRYGCVAGVFLVKGTFAMDPAIVADHTRILAEHATQLRDLRLEVDRLKAEKATDKAAYEASKAALQAQIDQTASVGRWYATKVAEESCYHCGSNDR